MDKYSEISITILDALKEELEENNIKCIYHDNELYIGFEYTGPQLIVDNNQLIFCHVFIIGQSYTNQSYSCPRKERAAITAVDLCDPDGFIKIINAIKRWYLR